MLIAIGLVIRPTLKLVDRASPSSIAIYIVSGGLAGLVVSLAGFAAFAGAGGMFGSDFRGYHILSFAIGASLGFYHAQRRHGGPGVIAAFKSWRANRLPNIGQPPLKDRGISPKPEPATVRPPEPMDHPATSVESVLAGPHSPSSIWPIVTVVTQLFSILFAVAALASAGFLIMVVIPQSSKGTGFASALLLPLAILFLFSAGASLGCWALRRRFARARDAKQ